MLYYGGGGGETAKCAILSLKASLTIKLSHKMKPAQHVSEFQY